MAEYGRVISHGFGEASNRVVDFGGTVGRTLADWVGAADATVHQVLPAAVPTWLLVLLVAGGAVYAAYRR